MQANNFLWFSSIALGLTFAGCAGNSASTNISNAPATDSVKLPPVETKAPNSDYKPAFEGQTRINGVKTVTPYKVEKIAEGLDHPWAVVPMPDGRLLITSKTGFMEIRGSDGVLLKKIANLPKVVNEKQGGLLDVALDPDFDQNKTIFWSYSEKYGVGNLTAVAKGQLSPDETSIQNIKVIFRATPALDSKLHFGSRLVFDKDGNLFVSAGERSILEGRKQAQLLSAGLGKIFKITKDGKPAAGNPFIGQKDAMPEIFAYGFRNPQGLDLNPVTGELWETEFGPRGGDEVNIVRAGKDYGWPVITYGIEYDGRKIGDSIQQKEGMEQPVYYWDPVISPSGIVFYTGDAIPEWKNNLFIGGLSSMHIARLVIENNKVVGEERLLEDQKQRIRDVAQYNGALYAVSDAGILFRISKQ